MTYTFVQWKEGTIQSTQQVTHDLHFRGGGITDDIHKLPSVLFNDDILRLPSVLYN